MMGWIFRAFSVGLLFLLIHGAQALVGSPMPWWGSLAAAAATHVALGFALKSLFMRAVTAPFKAKGAPLRGARLVVHSVTSVAAPARARTPALAMAGGGGSAGDCDADDCDADDDGGTTDDTPDGWRWFCVDATVTPPGATDGPFRHWAPCDLGLVAQDADTSPDSPDTDDVASIKNVEIFEGGEFVKDEGMSFEGERRLRLTIACAPELSVAKMRYYFEGFGSIELPGIN